MDIVRSIELHAAVPGHSQEQLTQTLIARLLKTRIFLWIQIWWGPGPLWSPWMRWWIFHLVQCGDTYSLFIYQDENEDENQSFCSFLYVLKQTCDEPTNNYMYCNTKGLVCSSQALSRTNEKLLFSVSFSSLHMIRLLVWPVFWSQMAHKKKNVCYGGGIIGPFPVYFVLYGSRGLVLASDWSYLTALTVSFRWCVTMCCATGMPPDKCMGTVHNGPSRGSTEKKAS